MNLKDTYNKIAEDWFNDHQDDTWWIEGVDKFISFLKPGSLVVDAGCGAGVKSKYLLSRGLKVIGIDFSEGMIEIARREVSAGTFQVADIKDWNGLRESFDGILAHAVLLHIPKAEVGTVFSGLTDKLKDGGYLCIAVKEKKPDDKEEEILAEDDYGYQYERFFSYFTLSEIKRYLAHARMKICYERAARSGHTNWLQVIASKEQ